ncbi:MAG: acyltransferase family protein [Candidatus Gracilibacteria bacterium]|nr:acyltransferase family protein [Candidatus Gracilibacteria bacterium]
MRINWIDNLRGIGILLIVLGHTLMPEGSLLTKYIFSFHVVLFFILSGLLFNETKHINFRLFLKNKFLRLIIPFILFNIIFIIIAKLEGKFEGTRVIDFAVGLFYGDYLGDNGGVFQNGGFNLVNISTWFLPALFLTSLYYFGINKFIKNKNKKLVILFLISIIIFIESKLTIFRLPWSAEIALMMTAFYGFANIFKKEIFNLVEKINIKSMFLLIPIILLHVFLLNSVNISTNYYGNYLGLILNSLLGFITILIIAKNIGKNKFLDFIGKNSIIILGFEWIKIIIIENINFLSFGLLQYNRGYLEGTIQFILTILFLIPIIFIINKYFPFIIGLGYKKQN